LGHWIIGLQDPHHDKPANRIKISCKIAESGISQHTKKDLRTLYSKEDGLDRVPSPKCPFLKRFALMFSSTAPGNHFFDPRYAADLTFDRQTPRSARQSPVFEITA
jgi:hypothetical protein